MDVKIHAGAVAPGGFSITGSLKFREPFHTSSDIQSPLGKGAVRRFKANLGAPPAGFNRLPRDKSAQPRP